jgi:tetratricopeptide (TPR) repeat protein
MMKNASTDKWLDMFLDSYENPKHAMSTITGLLDKINCDFTDEEKNRICKTNNETWGSFKNRMLTHPLALDFFAGTVRHFDYVKDYDLCEKIFDTVDGIGELYNNYDFLHFYYMNKIAFYYRNRDIVDGAFDKAVESCVNMLKIAKPLSANNSKRMNGNPSHPGYEQLAIILYKQGKYKEVVELCKQAKSEHWNGDWDNRIERAKKKLEKGVKK